MIELWLYESPQRVFAVVVEVHMYLCCWKLETGALPLRGKLSQNTQMTAHGNTKQSVLERHITLLYRERKHR